MNSYSNEGQQLLLEVLLAGRAFPSTYELGLTDFDLVKVSVLADAVSLEPSGNGYARVTMEQSVVGWPTSALDAGDWQLIGKNVIFTAAGGDITPFRNVFLTDGTSLIGWWNTVATIITDGNSLTFVPKVKQQ